MVIYNIIYNINESIRKGKNMRIQIKDNSKNGMVVVRNFNAQRKVERQLNEILARIQEINNQVRSIYE